MTAATDDLKRLVSMFDTMIANNDLIMNGMNDRLKALEESNQRHYDAINVVHENAKRFNGAVCERDSYVTEFLHVLEQRDECGDEKIINFAKMIDDQLATIRKTIVAVAEAAIPGQVEFVYEEPKTKLRLLTKDDSEDD